MNVDPEEKKCTCTMPALQKTPPDSDKKQSPEVTSPDTKQTQNNDSPKAPPVKALFQQTPHILSRHVINATGGSAKAKGTPVPPPTQTKAAVGAETKTRSENGESNIDKAQAADEGSKQQGTNTENANRAKDSWNQLKEGGLSDQSNTKPKESGGANQSILTSMQMAKTTMDQATDQTPVQANTLAQVKQSIPKLGKADMDTGKTNMEEEVTQNENQKGSNVVAQISKPRQPNQQLDKDTNPQEKALGQIPKKLPENQEATGQKTTAEAHMVAQNQLEEEQTSDSKQLKGSRLGKVMDIETPNTGTKEEVSNAAEVTQETTANGQRDSRQNDNTKPWMVSYYKWHTKHHQW